MKRQMYLLFPIQADSVLLFLLWLLIQIANLQYTIFVDTNAAICDNACSVSCSFPKNNVSKYQSDICVNTLRRCFDKLLDNAGLQC